MATDPRRLTQTNNVIASRYYKGMITYLYRKTKRQLGNILSACEVIFERALSLMNS